MLRSILAFGFALLFLLPASLAAAPVAPDGRDDVAAWLALARAGALPDCPAAPAALRAFAVPLPGEPWDETDAVTPGEACGGLRPGAPLSNGCTMNFVFTDGASLYIGTAGHCTGSIGQRMSAPGVGAFGSVVYRLDGGIGNDFGLIRVDADKVAQVNPQLCVWGGPTGAEAVGGAGNVLLHYGWGFVTSASPVTRARAHAASAWDADSAEWWGFGSPGDSGSPLVDHDGNAYAILTHGLTPVASPVLYGTNIQRILGLTADAGFHLQVVEADFLA
jgi:hypothetical protein